jgi:hypothetical protein
MQQQSPRREFIGLSNDELWRFLLSGPQVILSTVRACRKGHSSQRRLPVVNIIDDRADGLSCCGNVIICMTAQERQGTVFALGSS